MFAAPPRPSKITHAPLLLAQGFAMMFRLTSSLEAQCFSGLSLPLKWDYGAITVSFKVIGAGA